MKTKTKATERASHAVATGDYGHAAALGHQGNAADLARWRRDRSDGRARA